jgi:hypothetical protein
MEELAVRFAAELSSLRLDVVRAADAEIAPSADELEDLARQHGADVALRVSKAGGAVDLWLVNPRTREAVYRRVVAEGDPAVAVLRSLEILRGALVDLQAIAPEPAARTPPDERDASAERRALPPASAEPSLWLGLSGALTAAHARDLGAGVAASLRGRIGSRFALHAEVLGQFSEWSVEGQGGTAKIRVGTATVGALVLPWGEGPLTPGLGLGVGLLGLSTRGDAAAGFKATSDLNFAAFPHGRLELGVTLTDSFRLRLGVVAGFSAPRPTLLFAEERAQSWLNPLFLSSLGAEVALR